MWRLCRRLKSQSSVRKFTVVSRGRSNRTLGPLTPAHITAFCVTVLTNQTWTVTRKYIRVPHIVPWMVWKEALQAYPYLPYCPLAATDISTSPNRLSWRRLTRAIIIPMNTITTRMDEKIWEFITGERVCTWGGRGEVDPLNFWTWPRYGRLQFAARKLQRRQANNTIGFFTVLAMVNHDQRQSTIYRWVINTFKRRIKSHLPFASIIRSSPYSPR